MDHNDTTEETMAREIQRLRGLLAREREELGRRIVELQDRCHRLRESRDNDRATWNNRVNELRDQVARLERKP